MKKSIALCMIISGAINGSTAPVTLPTMSGAQREAQEDKDHAHATAKIAEHFSQLVTNFFKIAQNHHNSAEVGYNVAGILDNIIKIGLECIKRFNISSDCSTQELELLIMKLEAELYEQLNGIVIKRSKELLLP